MGPHRDQTYKPLVGQFWTPIVGQFWMPIDNQQLIDITDTLEVTISGYIRDLVEKHLLKKENENE
jgi:hypothetical protein